MQTIEKSPTHGGETERIQRIYKKFARRYDRSMRSWERVLFAGGREWVASRATGDVLEVAIGTGRNLPYYVEGVKVTGIDFSPEMLEVAQRRADELGRGVDLHLGDVQALEFPDESFDTVVCTLALCTIPDDRAAVREARRVLRAGGRLLLLEHVRSPARIVRAGQRLLEPLTLRLEGDHLLREPLDYLEAEGFEVDRLERSKWGIVERVSARRAAGGPGGS